MNLQPSMDCDAFLGFIILRLRLRSWALRPATWIVNWRVNWGVH